MMMSVNIIVSTHDRQEIVFKD